MAIVARSWLPLALALTACGDDEILALACVEPEITASDGACVRPGAPLDGCDDGFVHDGAFGCAPVLPAEACPAGLIAVPGDESCEPLLACGEGNWGEIPLDATAVFVDASYRGTSDGTADAPFSRIGDALATATSGSLVAVAAGTYAENITLAVEGVRLWGVCPERVELVGQAATAPAIDIVAPRVELHGLAVSGPYVGVFAGAPEVVVDRVRVHDTSRPGVIVHGMLGAASATVRDSLIEHAGEVGVIVFGAEALLERIAVRDTRRAPTLGHGIEIRPCDEGRCASNRRGSATVRRSLLERNHEVGLFVDGSDAVVEATVIRDTLSNDAGYFGRGIELRSSCDPGACTAADRSAAILRGSVIERAIGAGVLAAASDLTMERSAIRDTFAQAGDGQGGRGLIVQPLCGPFSACDPSQPGLLIMRQSVIERSVEAGLFVTGAAAMVETSVVRDTAVRQSDGLFGDGIDVASLFGPASATLQAMRIENSARAGVAGFGAGISLGDSLIQCAGFALSVDGAGQGIEDRGNNHCGCPSADGACKALVNSLEPPAPIPEP